MCYTTLAFVRAVSDLDYQNCLAARKCSRSDGLNVIVIKRTGTDGICGFVLTWR